jgi:serine/threonine/tyrosine-interacting protein
LGPYSACRDTQALKSKGITHIVCFFDNKESTIFRTDALATFFEFTCIEVSDSPLQNLIPQFPTATKLFNNAISSGGKVLACCNGGMSRSPTFVIAYIMETFRVDFIRAYQFVQGKRLCINPNEGFKSQLKVSFIHQASNMEEVCLIFICVYVSIRNMSQYTLHGVGGQTVRKKTQIDR